MRSNWCLEEGYFVCITIKNLPVLFLIDTGSNVTILGEHLFDQLLRGTGKITPFLGKANFELGIGNQHLRHTLLIADIENVGILGMDFLRTHHCDLVLSRQVMKVNGEEVLCFANSRNAPLRCCRVAVLEPVEIPPESEMIVLGYTKGVIDKSGTGLIEADENILHIKGLLVAKAFVCPTTGTVPVRIANPYAQIMHEHNCRYL